MQDDLLNFLSGFITEKRWKLFLDILDQRTRYITVVLEDIYQPHNASAVLRSCDCFGIQDVHIIENNNEYSVNKDVALGSDKWLNLYKYNEKAENTISAFSSLRSEGYRIVATTPGDKSMSLEDIDLNKSKIALVFGTELKGLSKTAIDNADEHLHINMQGFTESLNISVSAAIVLYSLSKKLREGNLNWRLSDEEVSSLKLDWLRKSIKRSDLLEKEFISSYKNRK